MSDLDYFKIKIRHDDMMAMYDNANITTFSTNVKNRVKYSKTQNCVFCFESALICTTFAVD